jgi:hypothetical protein
MRQALPVLVKLPPTFCEPETKKEVSFFHVLTLIVAYLPAHKVCCVGSAYRHHEAGQRGNLYLKRKQLKFIDKYATNF